MQLAVLRMPRAVAAFVVSLSFLLLLLLFCLSPDTALVCVRV